MPRVWFNRTFSNVRALLELIRRGDTAGEFRLVCSHTKESFPGFGMAHEQVLEPAGLAGEDYVGFCLGFCREHRIDVLWPGKEARLLAESRARFADHGVEVLAVADASTLGLLLDKSRFYAVTRDVSVPPPELLEFDSPDTFEDAYATLRQKHEVLCVKPTDGVNGAGFRVIEEGRGGLDILLAGALYSIHLDGLRQILREASAFKPLLLMEFLDGQEYSLDCVADGERLVAMVARQKAKTGGYGQCIVEDPRLIRAVEEMIAAFGLRGLFNAQFRDGRDGPRLLEINPRFSGGIGYAGATEVNLPYLALRGLTHGFPIDAAPLIASATRVLEVPVYCRAEVSA